MGFIYCFENLINHKIYVGKTIHAPEIRYKQHFNQINDGTVFHNALKKYGKENFSFRVLEEVANEELNDREKFYIKKLNTHWKEGYGYNMSYGGENSPDATYRAISVYFLDENKKPITETRETFKSITQACDILAKRTGKTFLLPNVVAICQGKRYSIFNYTFCYINENGEDIPTNYSGYKDQKEARLNNIKKCHEKTSIPIMLISPDKQEFYFNSIKEASREMNICSKTLKRILDNKNPIKSGLHKNWIARYIEVNK